MYNVSKIFWPKNLNSFLTGTNRNRDTGQTLEYGENSDISISQCKIENDVNYNSAGLCTVSQYGLSSLHTGFKAECSVSHQEPDTFKAESMAIEADFALCHPECVISICGS